MKFQRQILCVLPVVMLVCSVLSAPAQAQFYQQGPKLVGTGAIFSSQQGLSVSLSGDGNTAIVGGPNDNRETGAAWVFTRSGGVWSQQAKLVDTAAAEQGRSVSLSADGNTAIVGGPGDNNGVGAAWVFTRAAGVWSQQASWSAQAPQARQCKATPSRFLVTEIPPSLAGLMPPPRGCSPARAGCGASKRHWWAQAS